MRATPRCAARHPAAGKGFTLVEILLAVSIAGIVLAALYSTFFLADRALSAADERLSALQEARLLLDSMRTEIESACINDREYTVFRVEDRDFYGTQASQIELTSFAGPLPGLTRARYTVDEEAGTLVLRKTVASAYSKPANSESEELLKDIRSFTIEVMSGGKWLKTWDSRMTKALPSEVRLSIGVAVGPRPRGGESPSTVVFTETALPRLGAYRR